MNRSLKEAVRDEVSRRKLDDAQQEQLARLQRDMLLQDEGQPHRRIPAARLRAIGVLAACAMLVTLWFNLPTGDHPPQPQRIADEVALNHIKLKPLEVESGSIEELQAYFTELDFAPVENAMLTSSRYQLLGGRYCSIEGQPAAQLRVLDRQTGEVHSLYQTHYDTRLFHDLAQSEPESRPLERSARGMAVDIWVEHGLLFAVTRQPGGSDLRSFMPESGSAPNN